MEDREGKEMGKRGRGEGGGRGERVGGRIIRTSLSRLSSP